MAVYLSPFFDDNTSLLIADTFSEGESFAIAVVPAACRDRWERDEDFPGGTAYRLTLEERRHAVKQGALPLTKEAWDSKKFAARCAASFEKQNAQLFGGGS